MRSITDFGQRPCTTISASTPRNVRLPTSAGRAISPTSEPTVSPEDAEVASTPPSSTQKAKPLLAIRRHLPDERRAVTHHFSIAGQEGYLTVGVSLRSLTLRCWWPTTVRWKQSAPTHSSRTISQCGRALLRDPSYVAETLEKAKRIISASR